MQARARQTSSLVPAALCSLTLCVAYWIVPAAHAAFPYTAECTANNVYVRSGPDTNFYPVMKLNRGDTVTVVGESFGWLKIIPPKGAFSCIDKAFVRREGNVGYVTANRVWVRAGSLLVKDRSSPQTKLNRGDKVVILGEEGGFYRISPPRSAFLWVAARFFRPVARKPAPPAKPAAKPTPAAKPRTKPAPAATQPASRPATAPATEPTATRPSRPDWQKQLQKAEAALEAELTTPILQQQYDAIVEMYKPLAEQTDDLVVSQIARARLEQIAARRKIQHAYAQVQKIDSLLKEQMRAAQERAQTITPPSPKVIRGWDAKGILQRSLLFTGCGTPKLYRLVDPVTHVTIAYVEPVGSWDERLEAMVGKHVGLRAAKKTFKPDWGLFVYEPEEVMPIPPESPPASQPAPAAATQPTE